VKLNNHGDKLGWIRHSKAVICPSNSTDKVAEGAHHPVSPILAKEHRVDAPTALLAKLCARYLFFYALA
jgi:hypothetical protein